MAQLKGIIFGITNIIIKKGNFDEELFSQISELIIFVKSKGIIPVFLGNHSWAITIDGKKIPFTKYAESVWGECDWFLADKGTTDYKQTTKATRDILTKMKWETNEVIYVGNTTDDMISAVNGDLLFLNATWYGDNCNYGFHFNSPKDIAKFIDVFCLRDSFWHYQIEKNGLRYFALATFSTLKPELEFYSSSARETAKLNRGNPDFWTKYIISTIYLSGLYKEIDYIAVVPSSRAGFGNSVLDETLFIFAKCFRMKYLPDLFNRHTTINPSHIIRSSHPVDHIRQLNSIFINEKPLKKDTVRYVKSPLSNEKTLLIIDDFCTEGYSLDSCRFFASQTKVNVICMSWLKTINTDYHQITDKIEFNPYVVNRFSSLDNILIYPYKSYIIDKKAGEEITEKLQLYNTWKYPE